MTSSAILIYLVLGPLGLVITNATFKIQPIGYRLNKMNRQFGIYEIPSQSSLNFISSLRGGDNKQIEFSASDDDDDDDDDYEFKAANEGKQYDDSDFIDSDDEDDRIESKTPDDLDIINDESSSSCDSITETYENEGSLLNETVSSSDAHTKTRKDEDLNDSVPSEPPVLFPKHYYTTIFNHRNTIYGKGKFYTKRERIENLLHKWENDDVRLFQKALDDKESNDEQNDEINVEELEELKSLKSLIYERAWKYIEDVRQGEAKALEKGKLSSLTHPKKFLHYIAPKIAAIKQSPEIMLRIQSARSTVDVKAAVCALSALAAITEYYSCVSLELENTFHEYKRKEGVENFLKSTDELEVYKDIVTDRRFEQLIECVQCGVDVEVLDQYTAYEVVQALGKNESEIPTLKEEIELVDAGKIIWSMMFFLSHHNIDEIGGKSCTEIIQSLQIYYNAILINHLRDVMHGKTNHNSPSTDTTEDFVNEVKSLMKETVISLWASERSTTSTMNQYQNRNLIKTCCHILMQDVAEIWLMRQKNQDEESNVNDIIERLAESEEENVKSVQPDDKEDSFEELIHEFEAKPSSQTLSMDVHAHDKSFLNFLSLRDLMITLKALHKIKVDDDSIIYAVIQGILVWIETDLHVFSQSLNNTDSISVELVNAESILAPNIDEMKDEESPISTAQEEEKSFDNSRLTMSLNDLSVLIWIIGGVNHACVNKCLRGCMQLFTLCIGVGNIENLDNDSILKLFQGVVRHARNLFENETTKIMATDLVSNISNIVINKFTEVINDNRRFSTIEPTQLVSLISSVHLLMRSTSFGQHDKTLNAAGLINNEFDIIRNSDLFSLNDLSTISLVLVQSYQSENIPETMCHFLGKVTAKVFIELNRWQETCLQDNLPFGDELSLPISLESICRLFVGLFNLGLPPIEWCSSMSTALTKINHKIEIEDLVRLLHACTEMKINGIDNEAGKSLHLDSLMNTILAKQLHYSYSHFSPEVYVMFVWSMMINGNEKLDTYFDIPDEMLHRSHVLSPAMKAKFVSDRHHYSFHPMSEFLTFLWHLIFQLIGLLLSKFNAKTITMISILVNFLAVENEIQFFTIPEICKLASCLHVVKNVINGYDSHGTLVSESETLCQSLDKIGSSISSYFETQESAFSINQRKNLLAYFLGSTISKEVRNKALLLINSSVRNESAIEDNTMQKQLDRAPDNDDVNLKENSFGLFNDQTSSFTTNRLIFEKAWLQEILKWKIVEDSVQL